METQNIRHYKILREIGKGGMGIVYKALDTQHQREVALKVLPPTMVDRATVERFHREAQAMSQLHHANLVRVFDCGMEKGKHYLAMEFVDGDSLKNFIKHRAPLTVEETLQIVTQVAEVLAYTHEEGIIHRDIKPANIMITTSSRVKVMDFGLVKMLDATNLTMEGASLGTAEYMSPEQISGDGVDSRTDIYSLGITMYEMLAGRPPFQGDNLQAVLMKHREEPPTPLRTLRPDVPESLERLVMKAIAKPVAERYQKAQELLIDLQALKQSSRVPEPSPSVRPHADVTQKLGETKPPSSASVRVPKKRLPVLPVLFIGSMLALAVVFWQDIRFALDEQLTKFSVKDGLIQDAKRYLRLLERAEDEHQKGSVLMRSGKVRKAVVHLERAVQGRPDHAPYYYDLAIAYEQLAEPEKARATWEALLTREPTSALAATAQQHLKELPDL